MEFEGVVEKKRKLNTEPNILDLPNECLADIFHHLPLVSLFSTHETCKRFRVPSAYSFSKKYNAVNITSIAAGVYYICSPNEGDSVEETCNSIELLTFLRHFGSFIELLILRSSGGVSFNVTPLLEVMNNNPATNLKHLKIYHSMEIDDTRFDDLMKLFVGLEKLELDHCFSDDVLKTLLERCVNLKELSIKTNLAVNNSILLNITPNIERIIYSTEVQDSTLSTADSYKFHKIHPKLKSLRISEMFLLNLDYLKYLENVETLLVYGSYGLFKMNWIGLFQLKSLRQLEFVVNKRWLPRFFYKIKTKPATDIETLIIKLCNISNAYCLLDAFTFRKLKKLVIMFYGNTWLTETTNLDQVKILAHILVKMEEIHFMCFRDDFMLTVIEFVRYFENLKILVLDSFWCVTVDHLIQIAEIQRNKGKKLIVEHGNYSTEMMEKALKENPEIFSMLKFTLRTSSEFDYLTTLDYGSTRAFIN